MSDAYNQNAREVYHFILTDPTASTMSVDPSYRPGFNNCDQVNALCPVEASTYGDYFNLGGCVFLTVFYAIAFIYNTVIGIRGRTWTFSIFLGIGIVLELMGYAARIAMSPIGTVWNYGAFVIQLVMLILAPTLVAAAISVTFKWIVIKKGVKYSVLRPNLYPWIFVGTDFLSIIIQAIGGAISATATGGETNAKLLDVGSDLLVAGVAFQVSQYLSCERGDLLLGRQHGILRRLHGHLLVEISPRRPARRVGHGRYGTDRKRYKATSSRPSRYFRKYSRCPHR